MPLLMLLSGLRSYVDTNALFGRIAVRSQGIYLSISRKYAKTSYPNLLNTDFLALGEKASAACSANSEASEAIWTTLTDLMTSCIGFIVYLALLTNLNLWLAALVAATTAVSYFASKRINEWGYLHRSEELELTKRIEYANKTATSREFAKDIRMFGLRGWLEDLWGSTMRLYSAFCAKRERKYIWANIIDIVLTFLRNGIAYAFLIGITVKNGLPASQFLLYFAALSGFAQWVVEILDKLSVMHKQSLDISTIREFLDWDSGVLTIESEDFSEGSMKLFSKKLSADSLYSVCENGLTVYYAGSNKLYQTENVTSELTDVPFEQKIYKCSSESYISITPLH